MRRVLLACQGVNSHPIGFNVPSDRPVGVPAHAPYPVWDRHGECHRQQQLSGGCPVALGPRQRLGTAGSWDGASRELCSQPSRCDTPSPLHIPTGSCVGIPRVRDLEEPERCSGCSPMGTFGVRGNTGTSRGRTRPHSGTIQLCQSAAPRDGRRVLIANGLRPRAGSGRGGELAALMRGHRDTGMDRAAAGQSRAVQCCAVPSRAEPCRPAVGGPCLAALRYKAAPQQRWPRDAMCVPRCFFLPLLLFLLPLLAAPSPAVAPSGRPRARRGLTYPGTLWCGAGSNADSYEQLGKELCLNPPHGETSPPSAAPLPSTGPGTHLHPYPQLCPCPFISLLSYSPRAAPLPALSRAIPLLLLFNTLRTQSLLCSRPGLHPGAHLRPIPAQPTPS